MPRKRGEDELEAAAERSGEDASSSFGSEDGVSDGEDQECVPQRDGASERLWR